MATVTHASSPYTQAVCAALEGAPEVMGAVGEVYDVRFAIVHGTRPFFDDVQVHIQSGEMIPEDMHHPFKKAIDAHESGTRAGVSGFVASTAVGRVLYVEREMLLPAYQTTQGIATIAAAARQDVDDVTFGGFYTEKDNYWGAVGMINYARYIAALVMHARDGAYRQTRARAAYRCMVETIMNDSYISPEQALLRSAPVRVSS